ncbi:TPA: EscG/YscG/SsaH family type III secretion system needle protein co-chaperone [Yersinia enterocolitica]|uniref:EscG/YscG/SsaH family type III secretion system needle protein co-chaperone n=1 Tax=Yersinia enterocolitica TaxID=630 RepID=A0AAD2V2B9_YEREN|nr:EscG/YscG/SsaH family type III secretion system needle protein co-chaperone [Yersinia enterocolitica]AKF39927.1 type III secretion system protein, SsaH family [Yersinia enterocolitica]ALG43498.1 type III secretion system protein, SsaH family [Yersinia enterocolitica]EKN3530294.1 EscG/YscG/SsaH family type III secretion system needle protein co-chaperone [Yersinia enterocolitica]EKN3882521.1 EscG/YscG/SsaH family type III secretion system needle protein co-chaperone [Yersinia enterocolitica]
MILLSAPCRQLVVEAALAGVNHSLLAEARDILNVLPQLIPEPQVRLVCEAMLLFGLNQQSEALALLATSSSQEAQGILALLQQGITGSAQM